MLLYADNKETHKMRVKQCNFLTTIIGLPITIRKSYNSYSSTSHTGNFETIQPARQQWAVGIHVEVQAKSKNVPNVGYRSYPTWEITKEWVKNTTEIPWKVGPSTTELKSSARQPVMASTREVMIADWMGEGEVWQVLPPGGSTSSGNFWKNLVTGCKFEGIYLAVGKRYVLILYSQGNVG